MFHLNGIFTKDSIKVKQAVEVLVFTEDPIKVKQSVEVLVYVFTVTVYVTIIIFYIIRPSSFL